MPTERRQYERFLAPENALVALYGESIKIGKLIDISKGGLSFEHIYEGITPNGKKEKEVSFWLNDFRVFKLPCQVVYNIKVPPPPEYENLTIRLITYRCGVKFGNLSPEQQSQLELFIRTYGRKKNDKLT